MEAIKFSSRYMQFLSSTHGKIEPDTKTVSITRITLDDIHGLCWSRGVCYLDKSVFLGNNPINIIQYDHARQCSVSNSKDIRE